MSEEKGLVTNEPYQAFERLDEEAIADEVNGIYVKSLVYRFEDKGGRMVTGLSIRGVEEAARFMVKHGYDIACDKAEVVEEQNEYRASVKVTSTYMGKTMVTYGYSRSVKTFGNGGRDEFAYVKAMSKAQRNALRTVIPEKLMSTLVEKFMGDKTRVRNVTSVGGERAESWPPKREEATVEAKEEAVEAEPEKVEETHSDMVDKMFASESDRKLEVVRFMQKIPAFPGIDGKGYGPFKKEDVGNIPHANAVNFVEREIVKAVEVEPKKEQFKTEEKPTEEEPANQRLWPLQAKDGNVYGSIIVGEENATVKFDSPIDMNNPQIKSMMNSFLANTVLNVMEDKAKAEGREFSYHIEDVDGLLTSISVVGLQRSQVGELAKACAWAAMRAAEKAEGR